MTRFIESFKSSLGLIKKNIKIIGIIIFILNFLIHLYTVSYEIPTDFLYRNNLLAIFGLFQRIYEIFLILILIFFVGGFTSFVKEAIEDYSNIEIFEGGGRKHFKRIIISLVLLVIFVFVLFIGEIFFLGFALSAPFLIQTGTAYHFLIVDLVLYAPFIPILYFFQFTDIIIVVHDFSVIESFKQSFKFVWRRKLSIFGFSLISIILIVFTILPELLIIYIEEYGITAPLNLKILKIILSFFIGIVVFAVLLTYRVVYYIEAKNEASISV